MGRFLSMIGSNTFIDEPGINKKPPNVIVSHSLSGIEVIHLYSGRQLCSLDLAKLRTYDDINADGTLDQIEAFDRYTQSLSLSFKLFSWCHQTHFFPFVQNSQRTRSRNNAALLLLPLVFLLSRISGTARSVVSTTSKLFAFILSSFLPFPIQTHSFHCYLILQLRSLNFQDLISSPSENVKIATPAVIPTSDPSFLLSSSTPPFLLTLFLMEKRNTMQDQ